MSSTATLGEVVRASGSAPRRLMSNIVAKLDDGERDEFLDGLSDRIMRGEGSDDDEAAIEAWQETCKWMVSWFISTNLRDDPRFIAVDGAATQLLNVQKLGEGASMADLRARYARRAG